MALGNSSTLAAPWFPQTPFGIMSSLHSTLSLHGAHTSPAPGCTRDWYSAFSTQNPCMPLSHADLGTRLIPGYCALGPAAASRGNTHGHGEPKQPRNPAAALPLRLPWPRSSKGPGKRGEGRSPTDTTSPAEAKDQGLDTESTRLAACSDSRSWRRARDSSQAHPRGAHPCSRAAARWSLFVVCRWGEHGGPTEVPLPARSLPGHNAELHREVSGTTSAQCYRAKVTGMVRTVVGACKDAVVTIAVLPGQTLRH